MTKSLETLANTPLPTILVVAGIVFLLLSVAGKLSDKVTVPETRQKQALYLGLVLLGAGIVMSQMSVPATGDGTAAAEVAQSAARTAPAAETTDWEELDWGAMTPDQRQLWEKLGWTVDSWSDAAPPPATQTKSFDMLSTEEKAAAAGLGFTAATWDAQE